MFDPEEFWQYAISVLSRNDLSECEARVAAGRAYYSFFLTERERLKANNVEFRGQAQDHSQAIRSLRERRKDGIADRLQALSRLREHADYELERPLPPSRVRYAVDQALSAYENAKRL